MEKNTNILELLNTHYKTTYNDLTTLIQEQEVVYNAIETGERDSHRWWDEVEYVLPIEDGKRGISFWWAEANRDESVEELGWDFNEDSANIVEPKTLTVTKWV